MGLEQFYLSSVGLKLRQRYYKSKKVFQKNNNFMGQKFLSFMFEIVLAAFKSKKFIPKQQQKACWLNEEGTPKGV